MENLHFGQSILSALQQAVAYLHRMAGAKLHVQTRELKDDDLSLHMGDVVLVRFMNRGQFPVLIDNQVLLYPGETYVEGDTAGPGIEHPYKIEFLRNNADRAPLGVPNKPFLYAGNHLSVRMLRRKYSRHA